MTKMNPQSIQLRALAGTDVEAFLTWATDDEVTRSLMWNSYQNKEEALSFLVNIAEKHPWFKAVCVDGNVIGSITLDKGKGIHACKAEVGYVISKAHWSKGYATRALQEAVRVGFGELDVSRIEAFVDPDNIASARALEKAGFICEGTLMSCVIHKGVVRDRLLYSHLRSS